MVCSNSAEALNYHSRVAKVSIKELCDVRGNEISDVSFVSALLLVKSKSDENLAYGTSKLQMFS